MFNLFAAASVTALLAGTAITSPFVFSGWAAQDHIFTTVEEGKGKIIIKGDSFHRMIMSFENHHLNDPSKPWFDETKPLWEVLENKPGVSYLCKAWLPRKLLPKHPHYPANHYDNRPWLLREFGLFWVGLPKMRQIRSYTFSWNEYERESGNDGDLGIKSRKESTKVFLVNDFAYVMVLTDAKTSDNSMVRAEFVTVIRMTNPMKALIDTDNWLIQLETYIRRQARNFIGTYTYNQLRSETDDVALGVKEDFSKRMLELNQRLPEEDELGALGTKGTIGITIRSTNLEKIVLTGGFALENEQLTLAQYRAEQEAIITVTESEAESTSIRNINGAKADGIRDIGRATAEATAMLLTELAKHPEMAEIQLRNDALKSPGAGKVIAVDMPSVAKIIEKLAK